MRRTYKRAREGAVIPLPMSSPELLSEDTPPAPEGGSLSTLSTWLGVSHLLTQPRPPPLTVAASRPTAPIPLSTSLAANNTGLGVGAVAVLQQLPWTTGKDHTLVGLLEEGSGRGEEKPPSATATTSSTSTITAPSPPASSSPPHHPQPPPRMVQLHLDLGQRGFDQTKCRLCAMVYCPGVAEDEALHTSQCAKVASGVVTWAMAPKDDVVWGPGEDGIRVIHMQPGGGAGSHRVESVAALLLRMLGPHSVPKVREEGGDGEGGEGGEDSSSSSSSGGGGTSGPIPLHHYIAVGQGGGVVGALSTHLLRPPLTKFVVVEEGEGGVNGGGGGGLVRKPLEAKAVIGIDQVWVSAGVRRRGIGKVLIDAARKHTVYAYTVPVGEVAFSAPTGDGFLLAAAYRGGVGVGVGGKRFVSVY